MTGTTMGSPTKGLLNAVISERGSQILMLDTAIGTQV